MKSFVKIFIERFNKLITHRQLHYKIIINIEKNSKAIHALNKIS